MEESFEELLRQSEERTLHRVNVGQKLNGRVVALSKGNAFIDIGMRTEASMPLNDDEPRHQDLTEGQELEVYVRKAGGGDVLVGLDPVMGKGDFSVLETAHRESKSVEGKIHAVINGGYEINIAGVRCFCPHSQVDLRAPADPQTMVGQTFDFKVLEVDARKKNVVLSRRALLQEQREARRAELREKLFPEAVLTGRVADIQSFGAFIDFGGIQGLLHISQLAHHNVPRVEDVLTVGEEVDVKVLDITRDNRGKERISLSRKALLPNPWDELGFETGDIIEATIARKSNFGIFITVGEGTDGLLPKRLMKRDGRQVEMDEYEEGGLIQVEVLEINRHDRKITLALPGWNDQPQSNINMGESLRAEVVKVLGAGVIVQALEDPARGLIHKRLLGDPSTRQMAKDFPVGMQLDVVLTEIDDRGRYNFALKSENTNANYADYEQGGEGGDFGHNPFEDFFKG